MLRTSPELRREAELRRRCLLVCKEYTSTKHEPPKWFDQLPESYNWVYTVRDRDTGRWIARRWAQPKPTGEVREEVEAVLDLRHKEKHVRSRLTRGQTGSGADHPG